MEEAMENQKRHKKFTSREKLEIVIEGMRSEASIAEVCRRHGVSTTLFYQWRDRLFGSADEVFKKRSGRKSHKEDRAREEIERLRRVIAEITAENLELKKNGWEID